MTGMSSNSAGDQPDSTALDCTLEDFFLNVPPGSWRHINVEWTPAGPGWPGQYVTYFPDLKLDCSSEKCGGPSWFGPDRDSKELQIPRGGTAERFLTYVCKSCEKTQKIYALLFVFNSPDDFGVYKFGELAPYGPPLPAKVLRLFQTDVELFKKAWNAEKLGFGIAAFAYYRRIVENHRNELFDRIIEVAEQERLSKERLDALRQARDNIQFSQSMDAIKDAVPDSLKMAGHNPLVLLHDAFSKGVHELSDEHCLERAKSVRTILIALAERFALIRKEQQELKQALSTLFKAESG